MDKIMGEALERLKSAKRELACWKVKAEQQAADHRVIAQVLLGELEGSAITGRFTYQKNSRPHQIEWPTVQGANDILLSIENLKEEIAKLETTLLEMGIGPDLWK